jgi:four helix bundle suffix protein
MVSGGRKTEKGEGLIPKHGGYRKLKTFQIAQLIYDVTVRFCERYIDRRSRTHDQMAESLLQNSKGSRCCRFWPVGSVLGAGRDPQRSRPAPKTPPRVKIGATRWALAAFADSSVGSAVKARCRGFSCLAALDSAKVAYRAAPSSFETDSEAARSGVQNIAEGSVASATSKKTELKLTNVARASLEELRLDYEDFLRHRGAQAWPADHPALRRFKVKRCSTLQEFCAWIEDERGRKRANTDSHGPARTPAKSVTVRARPCPSAELAANGALSLLNLCNHLLTNQVEALAATFEKEGGFTERLYRVRSAVRRASP